MSSLGKMKLPPKLKSLDPLIWGERETHNVVGNKNDNNGKRPDGRLNLKPLQTDRILRCTKKGDRFTVRELCTTTLNFFLYYNLQRRTE